MSSENLGTRGRLLDAAKALLCERPDVLPSMGAVAARAGVSRQALYLHFADRSALLLELTRAVDAQERGSRQALIDQAPDGLAALRMAVRVQAEIKPLLYPVVRAVDTLRRTDVSAEAAWREREDARRLRCAAIIKRVAADGTLLPGMTVSTATDLFWMATSYSAWEDLVIHRAWPPGRYARELANTLERAISGSKRC